MIIMGISEVKREKGAEGLFKEIIAKYLPKKELGTLRHSIGLVDKKALLQDTS